MLKRFKESIEIILIYFIIEKYILINARNKKEFLNYIQIIIRYIKFTNINNIENQFIFIYQNIVIDLYIFVDSFLITIFIFSFI